MILSKYCYFPLTVVIPFNTKSIHGMLWKKRSNQSIGLFSSPFASIWSFSTMWGGLNGASPSVRHNTMMIPHDRLSNHCMYNLLKYKALWFFLLWLTVTCGCQYNNYYNRAGYVHKDTAGREDFCH